MKYELLLLFVLLSLPGIAQNLDDDFFPLMTFELCEVKDFPFLNEIEETIFEYKNNNYSSYNYISLRIDRLPESPYYGFKDKLFPIEIENKDDAHLIVAALIDTVEEGVWYYKKGEITFLLDKSFKPWVVPLKHKLKKRQFTYTDGIKAYWFFLIADGKLYTVRKDMAW